MTTDALRLRRGRARGASRVVRGRRVRPGTIARFLFIALFTLFVLAPFYWVAVTSIKPSDDLLASPPIWFPKHVVVPLPQKAAPESSRSLAI